MLNYWNCSALTKNRQSGKVVDGVTFFFISFTASHSRTCPVKYSKCRRDSFVWNIPGQLGLIVSFSDDSILGDQTAACLPGHGSLGLYFTFSAANAKFFDLLLDW